LLWLGTRSIKLPTREFASFRRGMVQFYNERQTRLYAKAKSLYGQLKVASKSKRNFDYGEAFRKLAQASSYGVFGYGISTTIDGYEEIMDAVLPFEQRKDGVMTSRRKPKAPKKKDFALLKQSTPIIRMPEASIGFAKKPYVTWAVSENNHAVERAHEHKVAHEFFKRLSAVKWVRGTGGEIIGNDENNRDSDYAGGGGNYVTHRFGVAEKAFRAQFRRF